jgi:AraC-like DNA-binding protein
MKELIAEIVDLAKEPGTRPLETAVPGLSLIGGEVPAYQLAALYKPMIGFVVRGSKILSLGRRDIKIEGPSYFLLPLHIPVTATVHPAPGGASYLSLGLELDHAVLQSLLRDVNENSLPKVSVRFAACDVDTELAEGWLRLLRLTKTPGDIPALAPVHKREILYRVLKGPQGFYLRQLGLRESHFSRIAQTVRWLRDNFKRPIDVRKVSRNAGMALTTFHRHFKRATGLSPIQFQKQLRLLEARNLMAFEGYPAAGAACEVGYESASQFNREYSRFFGNTPSRHASILRQMEEAR